jgi:hypothetical protein
MPGALPFAGGEPGHRNCHSLIPCFGLRCLPFVEIIRKTRLRCGMLIAW